MVCYNCFREKSSYGPCPFCGYDPTGAGEKFPLALKPGSILNGRYSVGRVLGQGGFGITYIAQDYQTKKRVAIKEYLPAEFAGRTQSNSVKPHSENARDNFEYGKAQFLEEAKTLAAFIGDEHIVRIYSYFEENNTAYFVMEYVDGYALDKYMAQKGGRLSVDEANRLLLPLMLSLEKVHAKGIIHRDIAPDNIIVTKDGTAKLIDFGAARYSTGEKSKSLDVILKHGFAPTEQYMRRGKQGPYTDVYALAATYYYAITGKILPDAVERMQEDTMFVPSTLGVKIQPEQEEALLKALEVNYSDRYHSMAAFHQAMFSVYTDDSGGSHSGRMEKQNTFVPGTADFNSPRSGLSPREEADLLEKRAREIRAEAERQEREERERLAREEAARREQERKEREARERAEKLERERKEREAKEAEERRKKELAEKKAREEAERQEKLRLEREKREEEKRLAAEKKKKKAEEKERLRQEAIAKRKADQEQQRQEAVRQKKEREEQKRQSTVAKQAEKTEPAAKKSSSKKKPLVVIIAAVLVVAAAVVYFVTSETKKPSDTILPTPQQIELPSATTDTEEPAPSEQAVPEEHTEQPERQESVETQEPVEPIKTSEDYYSEALALQAAGEWDAAIVAFTEAGDYEDATEQIQEIQKEIRYQEASDLLEAGQYREALSAFEELETSDFKDSAEKSEEIKHLAAYRAQIWSNPQIGDIVTYGHYEQDNNPENGKEEIEWLVLDREDDRILVISKYSLDCQPYNAYRRNVTWETCSLRKWMNSSFQSDAFSKEELARIPTVTVSADRNPDFEINAGQDTIDRFFLLSISEVNHFFPSDTERECKATEYAKAHGCLVNSKLGTCWWWLRSLGSDSINAANIRTAGTVNSFGSFVDRDTVAVRPTMWIETSELSEQYRQEAIFHGSIQTIGDTVFFGHYEQDNNLEDGKEPIEWIVADVQDGKSLLISKYVLDCKFPGKVSWKGSAARGWLNITFLAAAFDSSEQNMILMTETDTKEETEDQVFLLSTGEVSKYRVNICQPTAFAVKNGVYANEQSGNCQWWLRTFSTLTETLSYVNTVGGFMAGENISGDHFGVRPAIWVSWEQ